MGLLQRDADSFLQGITGSATATFNISYTVFATDEEYVNAQIQRRLEAKKIKNFEEADRIRQKLASKGFILEDTPQGTTWRRA